MGQTLPVLCIECGGDLLRAEAEPLPLIPGEDIWKLYSTHGIPLDIIRIYAEKAGLTLDEEGFNILLERQRELSRVNRK